jgi:Fe(II)/alpha-ketoglutarate-dependent arginine beta-hydroxylase
MPTRGIVEVSAADGGFDAAAAARTLAGRYRSPNDPELLRHARLLGEMLPQPVLLALENLRYGESTEVLVIRDGPTGVDPGPTPSHWSGSNQERTRLHDFWLMLVAGQMGEPFCWSTLQRGSLIDDIAPVAGEEEAQTGHGSAVELEFHVEDAFHDARCDALALICLRNDDAVPTTVATAATLDLAALDLDALFEPRFLVRPDPEHLRGLPATKRIEIMPRPVLTGARSAPYLRVDPYFTDPVPGDERAAKAFDELCRQLADGLVDVTLAPGDTVVIDNYRAVHGRRRFAARYDGTDRWLRKATVVRDLRKSRARRDTSDGRVVAPF